MNKSIIAGAVVMVLMACQTSAAGKLDLEPCINGEVSETGLFVSQTDEDIYKAAIFDRLDLEPCINGDVSESGLFASQAEEDLYKAVAQNLSIHGKLTNVFID